MHAATPRSLLAALVALVGFAALLPAAAAEGPIETTFHRSQAGSTARVDHSAWTKMLETHVRPGADGLNRVDYAGFKAQDHQRLKAYVRSLEQVDVPGLDRAEQLAYWANLYNARTVDIVLDHYPVASIKDIKLGGALLASGPWSRKVLAVAGVELSLDDIEHSIMRPYFKDPRVHYAVNCASVGCPNLMREAFVGARVEAQLEAGARAFVNSPRGVKVEGGKATASRIYSWFQKDFGGSETGVLAHLRQYAEPALGAELDKLKSIASYDYDWRLNDAKSGT
jgi:hypothetical protein